MDPFPSPQSGASLLLAFRPVQKIILIIGGNTLAASRVFSALEAEAKVIVLAKGGREGSCEELRWRAEKGQITLLDIDTLPCSAYGPNDYWRDAQAVDSFIFTRPDKVRLVCITDTVSATGARRSYDSAAYIAQLCRHRGIPTNVADMPDLCDYTWMSSTRFTDTDTGKASPLQVGVTTNGHGCRLAGRVRRDIVASLPKEIGGAVEKVGKLRSLVKASDKTAADGGEEELSEDSAPGTPNEPVPQRKPDETTVERARRRMKWVAQVSEYWPIRKLSLLSEEDMASILDERSQLRNPASSDSTAHATLTTPVHGLPLSPPHRGRIFLVGSGPGHTSLLTVATHAALTKHAQLVLSDKLVPAAVLALVPSGVEVRIARKFPGNADGAQNELMEAAIEAARRGLTVVRVGGESASCTAHSDARLQLKQGDPTVYGRAGEEVLYFRAHGFEPIVVPGVSSVLAGPTFAGIPVTQRGAAESFVVCTGVGRAGKEVKLLGYERSRTLVILMGVARLPQVLETLQAESAPSRDGPAYPPSTPIALIERASMPDQRVICSTLSGIAAGLESVGEQRPPGMLVVGWSVLSLWGKGDMTSLDDGAEASDGERVKTWLGNKLWRVTEGVEAAWEEW